jgi:hypothetical protein
MCLCSASVFGFLLHLPLVYSFTHFSSCFWSSFCTLVSTSASMPCLFAAVVCRFLLACCYIRSCQISSYLPSHLPLYLPSYASLESAVNLLYMTQVGLSPSGNLSTIWSRTSYTLESDLLWPQAINLINTRLGYKTRLALRKSNEEDEYEETMARKSRSYG